MAKTDNSKLMIGIAIIVAALIIAPYLDFSTTINQETLEQLETTIQEGTCSISLSKNVINSGDSITGKIKDGANTLCSVYANLDDTGWIRIGEGTTNAFGELSITDTLDIPGTFMFRAICGACVTDIANLVVNPLSTSEPCVDSDGNDIYTPGHVTAFTDGTTYYDSCLDEHSVTEFTCGDVSVVEGIAYACDYGQICIETRSGGYCADSIDDGLSPGDIVGSWEESHLISNSDTVFEMELTAGDDEIQLCAEIERSSYKVDPMCNPQGSLEDWAEFVFLDSTGVVWDKSDQIMSGTIGGADTFGNPDVLHVYWDGQTNFKGYMSHYGTCEMNMKLKITVIVCE